jgi:hypothetical protein
MLDSQSYTADQFGLRASLYCDGFAQGIVRRQPGGCDLAHAPRNSTVEVVPSCPHMDGCYTMHAW